MRDDYSDLFAQATPVRGKYFERVMRERGYVKVDGELLNAFPSNSELNHALKSLIDASKHIHLDKLVA